MEFNFKNNKSGNGGYFTVHNQDEELGRLTYTIMPELNKFIISYVNIYPKYEGNGYGKKIISEAIDYARQNHLKVYPHCSYANTVMHRMNDVDDILLKE